MTGVVVLLGSAIDTTWLLPSVLLLLVLFTWLIWEPRSGATPIDVRPTSRLREADPVTRAFEAVRDDSFDRLLEHLDSVVDRMHVERYGIPLRRRALRLLSTPQFGDPTVPDLDRFKAQIHHLRVRSAQLDPKRWRARWLGSAYLRSTGRLSADVADLVRRMESVRRRGRGGAA